MNLSVSLVSFLFLLILPVSPFPSLSSPRDGVEVVVAGVSPEFPPLYPATASRTSAVSYLFSHISPSIATSHLERLTSFHTRWHSSKSGQAAALWIRDTLSSFQGFKTSGATVELFKHSWKQNSIIAKIPASSSVTNNTSSSSTSPSTSSSSPSVVVLGAHIDSVNLWLPFMLRAPGANDNASGVVSLLEAFRLLLFRSEGTRHHEVHFHFYSGEESGVIGSFDIFKSYRSQNIDVIAALVLDMTGTKVSFGAPIVSSVVEDYVDSSLANYVHTLAETYLVNSTTVKEDAMVRYAKCGYACSDHASASRFGYPGALVTSVFNAKGSKSKYIHEHDSSDSVRNTEMESVLLHAKLAFAYAYELSRFENVPPKDQRKQIEMSFGDGFSGYMIRWCAARSTDPLGVALWVAVVVAVLCWLKIWRELAVLWPPMKRVMFLLLMFTARIIGGVIKLVKRKTRGKYQYDRVPMS